ncbi:MAG: hypothetical protein JO061_05920 [Acidobacteriaceae bacterium]|nr:hypothetical protein [Acidobacteriaceae bacterium]
MKNTLEPRSITLGLGLILTALCQAQQGNLQGVAPATPLSFKVPPHALSAISFSTEPNAQCTVAAPGSSDSGKHLRVFANDEGTVRFYASPSHESSSAAQLVATCSSGKQQRIEIQSVAGAKPLVARATSNPETELRLGHTVRPALAGDPMALSNQELVKRGYPMRPDQQQSPGAYASWLKAVSKPATFIPPKTVNVEGHYHGPVKTAADIRIPDPIGSDTFTSDMSSGYALYAPSSPFDWIEGDWNVPVIVGGEEGTWTSSTLWIGLSGVVPDIAQDGTEQDVYVSDGITYSNYYAWKQVGGQEAQVVFSNFSINPGDEIYSELRIGDAYGNLNPNGGYAYFWLDDLTTGEFSYLSTPFNSGTFTGIAAEWMLGRPQFGDGSYPDLANYWFAVMQSPFALTADGTTVNFLSGGDGATSYQVTMYNHYDVISTVSPINSNSMQFDWVNYH